MTRVTKEFLSRTRQALGDIVGKKIKIERHDKDFLRITVCDGDGLEIVEWCNTAVVDGNSLTLEITPQAFRIELGN